MKIKLAVLTVLLLYMSPIQASQDGGYYGVQYALVTYDEEGFDDAEPTALVFKIGTFATDNVAIEGRIGLGLQDDEIEIGPFDVDIEVESLYGIYGVIYSDTNSDTQVYGVLGYSRGELKASALGVSAEDDESGFSYGFGVNISGFNIEYMSYLDEDDFEATAVSLGYTAQFE